MRIKKLGLKEGAVFLKNSWSYEDQKENKDIRDRDLWNVLLIERKYLPEIYFSARIFFHYDKFKTYLLITIFCF